MDGGDFSGDDRTFKVNFSADGAAALRDRIREKLNEYMGDYTDDTLVEYVIVLLRNGRRKDEARNELHVFLGDDNIPFISWLWDHLSSNLHLYVEPSGGNLQKCPREEEREMTKTVKRTKSNRKLLEEHLMSETQTDAKERKWQKIEWEGSSEAEGVERERLEREKLERERLVERERVVERGPPSFPLKSVIASVLRDDTKDGQKLNNSNNKNNLRVGRKRARQDDKGHVKEAQVHPVLDVPRRLLQFAVRDAVKTVQHYPTNPDEPTPKRRVRSVLSESGASESVPDVSAIVVPPRGAFSAVRSKSVFDRLGGVGARGRTVISPLSAESEAEDNDDDGGYEEEMVEYSVARERRGDSVINKSVEYNESAREGERGDLVNKMVGGERGSLVNKPSKIVNISVNVNTWKPPGLETQVVSLPDNTKAVGQANLQKESPKTITPGPSVEDPASRTLFVSNVHFGATKDALSRHFNKFGAVLKVLIVTDPSTGQPNGSAYVEFMHKDSAEMALSLNGTSFMSRILKVVRGSPHEVGPTLPGWTRFGRPAPFSPRPAGRIPLFRGRPPLTGGVRSLQWKRSSPVATISSPFASSSPVDSSSPVARSFTYTRAQPKANS